MDKTVDKIRRGGLPAPTEHIRVVALGDGRPCDGCCDTVHPTETEWTIRLAGLAWRLHEECYAAWSSVRALAVKSQEIVHSGHSAKLVVAKRPSRQRRLPEWTSTRMPGLRLGVER